MPVTFAIAMEKTVTSFLPFRLPCFCVLEPSRYRVASIRRHFEEYGERESNTALWQNLLGELEAEQRDRITRPAKKSRACPVCGMPLKVVSITDNEHSPNGFDVIAHCESCNSDHKWFCVAV